MHTSPAPAAASQRAPACSSQEHSKSQSVRQCLGLSDAQPVPLHPLGAVGLSLPLSTALGGGLVLRRRAIFLHQNKAGGATVRNLLMNHSARHNLTLGISDGWDWSQWLQRRPERRVLAWSKSMPGKYFFIARPPDELPPIFMGDSVLGSPQLSSHCGLRGNCTLVTMFRDPVDRLVSSYMYCRNPDVPGDVLCLTHVCNARRHSLAEWAEHWGRFGLWQLTRSADDVSAWCRGGEANHTCCSKRSPRRGVRQLGIWQIQKRFWTAQSHLRVRDVAEAVGRSIEGMFTAVGLFENYSRSVELMGAAMGVPLHRYLRRYAAQMTNTHGRRNARQAEEKLRLLRQARSDARIRAALAEDAVIYQAAKAVFERQWALYNTLRDADVFPQNSDLPKRG